MATLADIRQDLDQDEPDYPALAQTHGVESLPQLRLLVEEDEPGIASKAAYLAGVIAAGSSKEVVALAARSRHDVVRVAAAAAAAILPADEGVEITSSLLQDTDTRVRVR